MTDTVDIVKLVQDHPLTKLSKDDYGSKIITKIKEKFTSDEEQLFVANFYCYLNYDSRKDFVIDLDTVWKWIGFSQKVRAKELLVNNFKKNEDYIITSKKTDAVVSEDHKKAAFSGKKAGPNLSEEGRNLGGSGLNIEIILLNIRCFKKLCLKAKTKKSNDIHEYYLNLEEIINDIVYEESTILRNQLTLKDQEYTETIKKVIKEKDQQREQVILDNFDSKNIVYIAYADSTKKVAKPGLTSRVAGRLSEHKATYGEHFNYEYIHESLYAAEIEKRLKNHPIMVQRRFTREYAGHNRTELFHLDETFALSDINKLVIAIKKEVETEETNRDKDSEINQLKLEIIKLKEQPVYTNPGDKFIYIEKNLTGENFYRITSSSTEIKENFMKFTYMSDNVPKILDIAKLFLKNYNKEITNWISITYQKIKQVLDFCILVYDFYHIDKNIEDLAFFISRYQSGRLTNGNKARVIIEKDVYQKFIDEALVIKSTEKATCMMICDEFLDWYSKNINKDTIHIKKENGHYATSFRDECMKNIEKLTGIKYISGINITDKTRGLNHIKCSGFKGLGIKNFYKFFYYSREIYQKYIDEFITVTGVQRHKVSRKELLDDFTEYAKEKNIYNADSFKKIFAPGFIKELIRTIGEITGVNFEPKKVKKMDSGIFIGLIHKNFDCIMHETQN